MKNLTSITCIFVIGLTSITQFVSPIAAYADGETTPVPADTSEVTSPPDPTEATVPVIETSILIPTGAVDMTATPVPAELTADPVLADTSIPTDSLDVTATVVPTELTADPVLTDTSVPTDSLVATSTPVPTEPTVTDAETANLVTADAGIETVVTEEPTLLEVIQELPSDTSVVVLDENGQPLSLATQNAADIIANGDPIWCPSGVLPIANTGGCTASTPSFNDPGGLLSYISNMTQDGTIWITSNYDLSIADSEVVLLDGQSLGTTADHALTIQGGWNGDALGTISGTSHIFNFFILDWNGDITINNVTQDVGKLIITTSKNAVVNTTANPSNGLGLTITNVKFNGQSGTSITLSQSQPVTVTFDWKIWNPNIYCPGCINQIVPGLEASPAGYCAYDGVPGPSNNPTTGTDTHTYDSLATGQTYYFSVSHDWQFSCDDALGNYSGKSSVTATTTAPPVLPTPVITTNNGKTLIELNCSVQAQPPPVSLPNGDLVEIHCPVKDAEKMSAEIARMDNTILPAPLLDGYTYASAFQVKTWINDKPTNVIENAGYIKASFVDPVPQSGNTYSILFWDEEDQTWVPLKDFLVGPDGKTWSFDLFPGVAGDQRIILSGVNAVTRNGSPRVEVSVNFPGIFVLAQH